MSNDPNFKSPSFSKVDKAVFAFAIVLAFIAFLHAGRVILEVTFNG